MLIMLAQTYLIFINYMTFIFLFVLYWNCNVQSETFYSWEGKALKLQTAHPLKELVMERHQEVCNASSQHEVPSK